MSGVGLLIGFGSPCSDANCGSGKRKCQVGSRKLGYIYLESEILLSTLELYAQIIHQSFRLSELNRLMFIYLPYWQPFGKKKKKSVFDEGASTSEINFAATATILIFTIFSLL